MPEGHGATADDGVASRPSAPSDASRRNLLRAGVWALPAVTVTAAAPAFAAASADLGAFGLAGSCGVLGLLGPGFVLTAGPAALPVGTTVTVTGAGVANIGVFSVTGGATANVNVLSPATRSIILTSPLPAGSRIELRTTLSISVAFRLTGVATLPPGYTAQGAKTTAAVTSTLVLCSAS
ncbi:hypothetical protein AAII07_10870 [Microvirga sp. 0TCS3.31]